MTCRFKTFKKSSHASPPILASLYVSQLAGLLGTGCSPALSRRQQLPQKRRRGSLLSVLALQTSLHVLRRQLLSQVRPRAATDSPATPQARAWTAIPGYSWATGSAPAKGGGSAFADVLTPTMQVARRRSGSSARQLQQPTGYQPLAPAAHHRHTAARRPLSPALPALAPPRQPVAPPAHTAACMRPRPTLQQTTLSSFTLRGTWTCSACAPRSMPSCR